MLSLLSLSWRLACSARSSASPTLSRHSFSLPAHSALAFSASAAAPATRSSSELATSFHCSFSAVSAASRFSSVPTLPCSSRRPSASLTPLAERSRLSSREFV